MGRMFEQVVFMSGGIYVGIIFLVPFLVVYVLGRLHASRCGERDGALGARVFLALMMSIGFQLVLAGIASALAVYLEQAPIRGPKKYGNSLGLILGGMMTGSYPAMIYAVRFWKPGHARVFRSGLGINAIFTGVVFSIAVTMTMIAIFGESRDTHWPMSLSFVYFAANLLCGIPLVMGHSGEVERYAAVEAEQAR